MTHFLLTTIGSAGDVHPFIAIAEALIARGHPVRLMTSPAFEDRVRRAGIDFVPIGTAADYEAVLRRPELWHPRRGPRLILREMLDRLPDAYAATAAEAMEPGTVLVGSTLSWATRLVQERTGLRAATVHLSATCIPSAIDPPVLPGVGDISWMPTWSVRLLQRAADRLVLDRWIGPSLNRFRAAIGLPPVHRIWSRWIHSPDLVIAAWPAWFAPPQADWPANATTAGFPVLDEGGAALPPTLATFLDRGPPPIGITPGSAMAHGRRFIARALDACRALDRRAIVITPYREQLPANLPDDVHHVPYAPFGALLPRLAVLVHHGGIGTCAQALRAALPQVVVPFAHDQFDNAARLRRLGVAVTLDADAPVSRWAAAFRDRPDEAAVRDAVRVQAERMASTPSPAVGIAILLESLAGNEHRARRS